MQRPQVRFPQQPIMITQQVNGGSSSMVGLHLILTICTCGLWLPFWVIIEIIQAGTRR